MTAKTKISMGNGMDHKINQWQWQAGRATLLLAMLLLYHLRKGSLGNECHEEYK